MNIIHSEIDIKEEPLDYDPNWPTFAPANVEPFYDFQIDSISSEATATNVQTGNQNAHTKQSGPASAQGQSPEPKTSKYSPKKTSSKKPTPLALQGYVKKKKKKRALGTAKIPDTTRKGTNPKPKIPMSKQHPATRNESDPNQIGCVPAKDPLTLRYDEIDCVLRVVTQDNIKFYPCRFCARAFKTIDVMVKHIHHAHPDILCCDQCAFSVIKTKKFMMDVHQNEHFIGSTRQRCFQCPHCFLWYDVSTLTSHVQSHYPSMKRLNCNFCQFTTRKSTKLNGHLWQWHKITA